MPTRATASCAEACSSSGATALVIAIAPRIIVTEPAMTSHSVVFSHLTNSLNTKPSHASPHSWLVFESGMPRPMPMYLAA